MGCGVQKNFGCSFRNAVNLEGVNGESGVGYGC